MKGYVGKNIYDDFLNKKWFGKNVPQEFIDYNARDLAGFPFWSSEAIT